jgi:hypothetical protein
MGDSYTYFRLEENIDVTGVYLAQSLVSERYVSRIPNERYVSSVLARNRHLESVMGRSQKATPGLVWEFHGHLDGYGHTVTISGENCVLVWENNGTIHDLTVKARLEDVVWGPSGVIANINKGTIRNCTTDGINGEVMINMFAGTAGGIGGLNLGLIEDSTNNGTIYIEHFGTVGGIVGENIGEIKGNTNNGTIDAGDPSWYYGTDCVIGGIAGDHWEGEITGNKNTGEIHNWWGSPPYSHIIGALWGGTHDSNTCLCCR